VCNLQGIYAPHLYPITGPEWSPPYIHCSLFIGNLKKNIFFTRRPHSPTYLLPLSYLTLSYPEGNREPHALLCLLLDSSSSLLSIIPLGQEMVIFFCRHGRDVYKKINNEKTAINIKVKQTRKSQLITNKCNHTIVNGNWRWLKREK
jgi:hypothetical protein